MRLLIMNLMLSAMFICALAQQPVSAQQRKPHIWILDITPNDFGAFFNPFYNTITGAYTGYDASIVRKWDEITSAQNDVVVLLIATRKTFGNPASAEEIKRLMGLEALENYNNQTLHAGGLNSGVPDNHTYRDALNEARNRRGFQGTMYNMVISVYNQCNSAAYVMTNFDFITGDYERHGADNGKRVVEFVKSLNGK